MSNLFKDLKTRNILSKEQMQSIRGGACGVQMIYKGGRKVVNCTLTIQDVQTIMDNISDGEDNPVTFNWCCDSCYKSSYCGGQNAGGQGLQDSFQTHVTHP